mmetsp:Transcript_17198/g.47986  ORF Transcript_17198/g.47986 Transcript_17198/m.47986 type:complete len:188 (-) Transcript_17198:43-606(-)
MALVRVRTVAGKQLSVPIEADLPVSQLRSRCSEATGIPLDRLKLVLGGAALSDADPPPKLTDSSTILALSAPKQPPAHLSKLVDSSSSREDGEDEKLDWKAFLLSIHWKSWLTAGVWFAGVVGSSYIGHAIPYLLLSGAAAMLLNLGKRQDGEASAYSIFNGFQELPGQLNAQHFEQAIRRGEMIGM